MKTRRYYKELLAVVKSYYQYEIGCGHPEDAAELEKECKKLITEILIRKALDLDEGR